MIESIRSEKIERALQREYRQYLTGHLERPQIHLPHIEDDIEVGISSYQEFTADVPHVHNIATEHGYILEGTLKIRLLNSDSDEEFEYKKGDFFVMKPGMAYATKNAPGTKVLFIKAPGVNDKEIVSCNQEIERWLSQWD